MPADVTLALRGERVPLRNAVSSVYNAVRRELLVATPTALYLYGRLLTAGGDLLATLAAEEGTHYQHVLILPWLDAYSVVISSAVGGTEHRIVSCDLKTSLTSHTLTDKGGQFYTALANPHRRELLTADTDGGIKVWALRVMSTAHNNGGFKGVLRVHTAANSTKKPYYRHLRMSCDGQKLFAATSTKVYVFDAASCSRLQCCLREDRHTIFSMECGRDDLSVYLVFRINMRKICKYSLIVQKGVPQFRRTGEYEHDQELAVFIETDRHAVSPRNGVVLIDICARLLPADFDNAQPGGGQAAVALPFNPPSERYNALHAERADDGRTFAFAVWSTGFCIAELFFPDARGRLPCSSFNGERLKRLDGVDGGGSLSIYQRLPSAEVILFQEGVPTFRFASLPTLTRPNNVDEETEEALAIVEYVVAADAIVALWPHGLVEKHNLSDTRVFTVAPPFEAAATTASVMISLLFDGQDCVAVGDSTGAINVFPLLRSDAASHSPVAWKHAHANDSVSTLLDLSSDGAAPLDSGASLLSVSRGGEVKHWHVKKPSGSDAGPTSAWDLVACFRTYSPDVSSVAFERPEFLFCGFDGGSVECWRLPPGGRSSSKAPRLQQHSTRRVSVVKRALHSIDLHLAPVLSIASEPGAGASVLATPQPVADNFSWVFSYDEDAVILIWCFSLDLFFPHRRLQVHALVKGVYVSPASGSLDLFAYVDSCIDRIDRLDITLPAVEHKASVVRATSAGTSPVKACPEEPKQLQAPASSTDKQADTKDTGADVSVLHDILSSSPTRILDRPPSTAKTRSPIRRRSPPQSPRRKRLGKKKAREHKPARDGTASFVPGENSLPSSFQQAKPRVYRNAVNPLDSLSSQARCAVVTAGDAHAPSTSCSSESDSDPDVLGVAGPTLSAVVLDFGPQEKVSVVSLVDDEDESMLLLDYRPGSHRPRPRKARRHTDEQHLDTANAAYEVPFLPWDQMSERDRQVELMAASKSRGIQQAAERDDVVVPPVGDFESAELGVQLGVRSFTRWFAATHRHHQRVRERFLLEELLFAAVDPVVHQKLAEVGLSPPPPEHVGSSAKPAWQEFVSWYCLGLTTRHQTIPPEVLQRERLKARTEYLELRLRMVRQSELEVQDEEERAGPCEEACEPPQRVFVFEHFVKRSLSDQSSPTSWDNTSLENRQKEITLALMDPAVQVAAMRNDIELPDVSGSCLDDFDILALAGKFVPWWKTTRNIHRRDFLKREAHEAATSKAILELLSKEQHSDGAAVDRNGVVKDFFEAYFRSDTARHAFLKKKLFYLKRKSRIASVARYGKLPAPLVVETLPLPIATAFEFVERVVVEEEAPEEHVDVVEEEAELEEPEVAEPEQPQVDSMDNQREQEEEELRRREGEKARITLELIYMAREDALSREFNSGLVESDDEVEEPSLAVPKRTDFSRSYFFGNLPAHFRKAASSGWRAGSGVDNGDEEFEEEEQLERERERQRLLDEQEAERLLELERQAERARIEKEREEKAFQFRRVRQAELRKVLVHQAELEAQRKADLELERERVERAQMLEEDESACWHRNQLAREHDGMLLEDQRARQFRKELRDAAAARMRLQLHEQACMSAEDELARLVGQEQQQLERQRAVRTALLSELYTPFRPFYQESAVASEAFLPRIQWRLQQEQQRRTPVKPAGGYTIPLEEALAMDELDQEPYLARDSRKFKLLMGLPLRTPSSQKRPRIPTADAIITMQQRQRADFDEERQETSMTAGKHAPLPHKAVILHSHSRKPSERQRLPDIVSKPRAASRLTDLKEACRKQGADAPTKHTATNSNQNQQNQSLPFFRVNMLVQGHGQARSKDYTY